jgi:hypothetical protein
MQGGHISISSLENMPGMVDAAYLRPQVQWWLDLRPIARLLSQSSADAAIFTEAREATA